MKIRKFVKIKSFRCKVPGLENLAHKIHAVRILVVVQDNKIHKSFGLTSQVTAGAYILHSHVTWWSCIWVYVPVSQPNKPTQFKMPDKGCRVWNINSVSSFHVAPYACLTLLGKSRVRPASVCKWTTRLNVKINRINYLLRICILMVST